LSLVDLSLRDLSILINAMQSQSITHIDWKPGQRDAPLPPWVFIVPTGVAVSVVFVLWYRIVSRREKELKEWVETGDLEVKE